MALGATLALSSLGGAGGGAAAGGMGSITSMVPSLLGGGGKSGGGGMPSLGGGKQMAMGAAQLLMSARLNKKLKNAAPPKNDPAEQLFNVELDNMRKGYGTGAKYGELIRQLRVQGNERGQQIMSTAGGNSGAALNSLAQLGESEGNALGKIYSEDQQNQLALLKMFGDSTSQMAQRRAGLDLMRYSQLQSDKRETQQAGMSNLLGGNARNTGANQGGGGGAPKMSSFLRKGFNYNIPSAAPGNSAPITTPTTPPGVSGQSIDLQPNLYPWH